MIGAVKGYPVEIVMSEAVSIERRKMIQAFGAKVTLTDAKLGTDGAIVRARQLVRDLPDRYFMPDQFSNQYNQLAHYEGTAQEILRADRRPARLLRLRPRHERHAHGRRARAQGAAARRAAS